MINEQNQKLRSITLTSGTIKDLSTTYDLVKIRGSVAFHQDIHTKKISTYGHSSFHEGTAADVLKNAGSCVLKRHFDIKEIVNTGNLRVNKGRATKISSSGKLTVEDILQSEKVDVTGIVQAKKIHTNQFQLKLSGESFIERLTADEVHIEKERITISLLRKKLICTHIKGKRLQISCTDAEMVEGDTVIIGDNCTIQTLYYKENYTISPKAKVQHIVRNETQ